MLKQNESDIANRRKCMACMCFWRALIILFAYYNYSQIADKFSPEVLKTADGQESMASQDSVIYSALLALKFCIVVRFLTFALYRDYAMFLFDLCNASNFLLIFFVDYAPKCEWLFATCYFFTMGSLIFTVTAFREDKRPESLQLMAIINFIIEHSRGPLDTILFYTCMAVHPISAFIMMYIRWWIVPSEEYRPSDEYRNFAGVIDASESWSTMYHVYLQVPYKLFFIYFSFFYFFVFLVFSKVRALQCPSTFAIWF